jgi:predicted N-acyltransferase
MSSLLEPQALLDVFQTCPPIGFRPMFLEKNAVPGFVMNFNLLTTLDHSVHKILDRIPFIPLLSRHFLSPRTLFMGTTVSEYLPYHEKLDCHLLVKEVLSEARRRQTKVIIFKDIPSASPLLNPEVTLAGSRLIKTAASQGFVKVAGQALAYLPIRFNSIDDYLASLSRSRRKNLRRKLRKRQELTIDEIPTGDACFRDQNIIDEYYDLYCRVYDQSEIHFDKLSCEFFAAVFRRAEENGIVFCYRQNGLLIGWNLCFVYNNNLIDKYIGLRYPEAHDFNLYFVSWVYNVDYAIRQRLDNYVAGWTDPQVKASLGAKFTLTQHAVYFENRLLRLLLQKFQHFFEADRNLLMLCDTNTHHTIQENS